MTKIMIGAIAAVFAMTAVAATSTPQGFTDNLDEALKRAKANKRYVVAVFSGSDWCSWCKKLEKEILSTEAFRKGAVGRYELVYIDNPRDKDVLSEHAKKNNNRLTNKYGVRGFPSVLILDGDGKKVAELGYDKNGPERYLEKIEEEIKYAPDVKKYIVPIEEVLSSHDEDIQEEIQEAMKVVGKKYVAIYEKELEEARAMKVPAHMEKRKGEVISKKERELTRLKSFVEDDTSGKAKKTKGKK